MRIFKITLILKLLFFYQPIHATILIITHAYNRPDFIELQAKTFKKFLKDDYEFVVFDDSRDHHMEELIQNMCTHYAIRYIKIPQEIHNRPYLQRWPEENNNSPTVRNCNAVQYSLDQIGFDHDDIIFLVDSDVFLVKEFSIRAFMDGRHMGARRIAAHTKPVHGENHGLSSHADWLTRHGIGDLPYLWHGLTFLDMRILPNKCSLNFNCGRVEGYPIDAGGHSYYYLKNNPDLQIHWMDYYYSEELQCGDCMMISDHVCKHNTEELRKLGFDDHQITFLQNAHEVEFYNNKSFLHYRCGSNWNRKSGSYHQQKTQALQDFIEALLS